MPRQSMKSTLLTLLAGLCLLIPGYFGSRNAGCILSPVPLLPLFFVVVFAPYMYGLDAQKLLVVLPTFLFFAWNPRLLRGQVSTPKRTYVLVAVGIVLGVAYLVHGWSFGIKTQGVEYTLLVCVENFAWSAILCVLFFRSWKAEPSFVRNLALHWVLFAWLTWYAFPFLGHPF